MAVEHLTDGLSALNLSDPDCVRFRPSGDRAWLHQRLGDVPRYLFRVFTPESCGTTDRSWTKSKDARSGSERSSVDILTRHDDYRVADMLNKHLRWRECSEDNFVSWTSSLLFALQYVFYLHTSPRDGSPLDEIKICIVDTSSFPKGVFLQDLDLIRAYCRFELGYDGLEGLQNLRSKRHRDFTGSFYFGEYLSQGALRIEGKSEIISAQAIIDQGLFNLQPEFKRVEIRHSWANEVIRLREIFYQSTTERQRISQEELQAAIDIAYLFEPRWRLPVAGNIIALLPRRDEDSAIVGAFRELPFTGSIPSP